MTATLATARFRLSAFWDSHDFTVRPQRERHYESKGKPRMVAAFFEYVKHLHPAC